MKEIDVQSLAYVPLGVGRIGNVIDSAVRGHSDDHRSLTQGRDSWNQALAKHATHMVLWYQFGWEHVCDDGWVIQVTFTDGDTYKVLQGWLYETKTYPEIEAMKELLEVLRDAIEDNVA